MKTEYAGLLLPVLGSPPVIARANVDSTHARSGELLKMRLQSQKITAPLGALGMGSSSAPAPSSLPTTAATAGGTNTQPTEPECMAIAAAAPFLTACTSESQEKALSVLTPEGFTTLGFFRGTTLNFERDGCGGYDFDQSNGRGNLLRVYDVSSNTFSIHRRPWSLSICQPRPSRECRKSLCSSPTTPLLQVSCACAEPRSKFSTQEPCLTDQAGVLRRSRTNATVAWCVLLRMVQDA